MRPKWAQNVTGCDAAKCLQSGELRKCLTLARYDAFELTQICELSDPRSCNDPLNRGEPISMDRVVQAARTRTTRSFAWPPETVEPTPAGTTQDLADGLLYVLE